MSTRQWEVIMVCKSGTHLRMEKGVWDRDNKWGTTSGYTGEWRNGGGQVEQGRE
jgi:hypothetical protein